MNQLLSVNCVFVAALHRLHGASFFASVLQRLSKSMSECHQAIVDIEQGQEGSMADLGGHKTKLKNILNCLLHFYLF